MTRTQMLIAIAILALGLPLGAAVAQTPSAGTAAPAVTNPARTLPAFPDDVPSPMQEQAIAPSPNAAPKGGACSASNAATMMDEFGRQYNCRGERLR